MLYQLSYASTLEGPYPEREGCRDGAFRLQSEMERPSSNSLRISQSCPWNYGSEECLADELNFGPHRNDAAFVAHLKQLADGVTAIVAVVESALVDIHADEAVGEGRV